MVDTWAYLKIVINDVDLTFYRDIPTLVKNYSEAEPFGPKTLTLVFPGISSFEPEESWPFDMEDNVDIYACKENGEVIRRVWEGYITADRSSLSADDDALTVECAGALYQADLFLKPPGFGFREVDAGEAIRSEINLRVDHYGLRLARMPEATWGDNPTSKLGTFNKLLTGWISELLADSSTPPFMTQNENATTVLMGSQGVWVAGDHGSIISLGPYMPNFGSHVWRNVQEIYVKKNRLGYVSDVTFHEEDGKVTKAWSITQDGRVWPMGWDHVEPFSPTSAYSMGQPGPIPNGTGADPFVAIEATPSGNGYWCVNSVGNVWAYGDAVVYSTPPWGGSTGPGRTSQSGKTIPFDIIIDMVPHGSTGYWLISWLGRIYNYGSAPAIASEVPFYDRVITGAAKWHGGDGFWVVHAEGTIDDVNAPTYGGPGLDPDLTWKDISSTPSGDGFIVLRDDGKLESFGAALTYGGVAIDLTNPGLGGETIGYTIALESGRRPVLRTKNMWDVHHEISVGTPGLSFDLDRDSTSSFNAFYGEGTDPTGGKWRNSKYANVAAFSGAYVPPPYPGFNIDRWINNLDSKTDGAVSRWQATMRAYGWPVTVDGVFDTYDASVVRVFQVSNGIPVTGVVDAATWNATFMSNPTEGWGGVTADSYVAPLVAETSVEPFLYKPNGQLKGPNPSFNVRKMRREMFTSFGEKVSKMEGLASAYGQLKTFADPGYVGTITMLCDPDPIPGVGQYNRKDIRAGQNIKLKGFRGKNIILHISEVSVDVESDTVTLQVDTQGRDYKTVAAMLERDRSVGDAMLVSTRKNSKAKTVDDEHVLFDAEAGAGFIPAHQVPGGSWSVVKVPFGEMGEVVKTTFRTSPPTFYVIAVFDRPVTAQELNDYTAVYEEYGVDDESFWYNLGNEEIPRPSAERPLWGDGLIVAWGGGEGSDNPDYCGTYPLPFRGDNSYISQLEDFEAGDRPAPPDLSGRFSDNSSFKFWSSEPPWVWVAIYCLNQTFIEGQFYGGASGGFNFSDIDTIASPQKISPYLLSKIGADQSWQDIMESIRSLGS